MKRIIRSIYFVAAVLGMTSCLKEGDSNIPPDAKGSVIEMLFVQPGGTTINSGLNYFAGAALTYPGDHVADTATFVVSLQGAEVMKNDVTVNLVVDSKAVNDNIAKDEIDYQLMPDSLYDFISETAVIKAGERSAEFKVIFYPNKIDATQNYNLPVTASNSANIITSANFGKIYFHSIGNPIAGSYKWDFFRYNSQDQSVPSTTWIADHTILSPVNPTTVKVATGYYTQPNYLITFTNTDGVLSDFKAVINPDEITAAFTNDGISVVSGPTLTVSENNTKFTINYVVYNGSAYRNITDIFYK